MTAPTVQEVTRYVVDGDTRLHNSAEAALEAHYRTRLVELLWSAPSGENRRDVLAHWLFNKRHELRDLLNEADAAMSDALERSTRRLDEHG